MLLSIMPLLAPMTPSWNVGGAEPVPEMRSSGPSATYVPMSADERAVLEAAEREASADLVYLRGGDISNSTLMTVVLVLAIVVLIVILV
jgi:hypothetical protein